MTTDEQLDRLDQRLAVLAGALDNIAGALEAQGRLLERLIHAVSPERDVEFLTQLEAALREDREDREQGDT